MLKSKNQNGYQASIRVDEKSTFIDSLLTNPSIFKEEKLKFKWTIKDKDAVYVPDGAATTSANGLNK
jgi:hypothetical protein